MLGQLEGEGAEIPRTLIELRHTMDEINPNVLSQPTGIAKWVGKVPGVGTVLKRIAVKYESVQTQIDHIMNGLRHGKDKLLQDNAELEQLYEQVGQAQRGVQESAYIGELLWAEDRRQAAGSNGSGRAAEAASDDAPGRHAGPGPPHDGAGQSAVFRLDRHDYPE